MLWKEEIGSQELGVRQDLPGTQQTFRELSGTLSTVQALMWNACSALGPPTSQKLAAGQPSFSLPSLPPPPEKACLLQMQSSTPSPASGLGGLCPWARPWQHPGVPVRDADAPGRAARPATCHGTGEAVPAPHLILCTTLPPTHETRTAGFSPAETHTAWHVVAVHGILVAQMTSTSHLLLLGFPRTELSSCLPPLLSSGALPHGPGLSVCQWTAPQGHSRHPGWTKFKSKLTEFSLHKPALSPVLLSFIHIMQWPS